MTGIQAPEYISDSGSDNDDFTLHRALCSAIWTRGRRALRPCAMPVDCLSPLARLAPAWLIYVSPTTPSGFLRLLPT